MWKNTCKLLLFDLDGTLLQSDKTISKRTLSVLKQCREKGILIGVSTSRSEQNSLVYLNELMPDILISSGGALVKYGTEYIYKAEFSVTETNAMIDMARIVCGNDCEITIDTTDAHYWNYKVDPKKLDQSWGDSIYTDFSDFTECSLKMCVEIFEQDKADELADRLQQQNFTGNLDMIIRMVLRSWMKNIITGWKNLRRQGNETFYTFERFFKAGNYSNI